MPTDEKARTLYDQFNTILFGASIQTTVFYSASKKAGLESIGVVLFDHQSNVLVTEDPDCWELRNDRVQTLGRLFLTQDMVGKNYLIQFARDGMKGNHRKFSAYLFTFLAKYHRFRQALEWLIEVVERDEPSLYALLAVSNNLKFDPNLPTDDELKDIPSLVLKKWETLKNERYERPKPTAAYEPTASEVLYDRLRSAVMRIVRQAQEIKLRRLKTDLSDKNLEINQDRKTLTSELSRLGFSEALVKSLEHAENEYRKADSVFDFKTSADHNRSFFDELLWEMANKVAALRGEPLTVNRKFAQEVRDYLKKSGFFTDRFHKLCEAFYLFASEQSTHKLSSGREVARIVRNMNIELGLLLMKRMDSFKQELP